MSKSANSEVPRDEPDDAPSGGAQDVRDIDDTIIDSLVAGRSQSEAGRAAHRSERTVRRRLQDPDFLSRLAEAREEHLLLQRARSAAIEERATATIEELLDSTFERVFRIRAAATALRWTAHVVQIDLETRLATLEDRLGGEGGDDQ